MMKLDNFLFDVCHSACLMYEEGQNYHFLHRSFQEYFFANCKDEKIAAAVKAVLA